VTFSQKVTISRTSPFLGKYMTQKLSESYKGAYPFKLATTSFIYPDHYIPNVKLLGPYLDEIELLMFESVSVDSLPKKKVIRELADLANELDISYNIHLPVDIFPGASDPAVRDQAVDTILHFIDRTAPLCPSTHTLHFTLDVSPEDEDSLKAWQENLFKSCTRLTNEGVKGNSLSIETLSYPLELIETVIRTFNLSVCIDIGHLVCFGFNMDDIFKAYGELTSIIHLHGVKNKQDHLSLECFTPDIMENITVMLREFKGTVSLEVFTFGHLQTSLKALNTYWTKTSGCKKIQN